VDISPDSGERAVTKTIAYTALHYGADYLAWAIRSIIDYVDEYWVLFSPVGSHGHSTSAVNPDHAADLFEIAQQAAGDKLRWYSASPYQWKTEGEQREYIHTLVPDADVILVLDADEIWSDGLAVEAIEFAQTTQVKTIRLPFIHLWRSFRRGFAHDPAYPTRVIVPKNADGDALLSTDKRIWHFGYAQRSEIVEYKIGTHGHRGEWRKDCDWLNDVFLANRQFDCHPVGSDFWNCEDIDQSQLPTVLTDHPYRKLDIIP
jgi:hypothetical protein